MAFAPHIYGADISALVTRFYLVFGSSVSVLSSCYGARRFWALAVEDYRQLHSTWCRLARNPVYRQKFEGRKGNTYPRINHTGAGRMSIYVLSAVVKYRHRHHLCKARAAFDVERALFFCC